MTSRRTCSGAPGPALLTAAHPTASFEFLGAAGGSQAGKHADRHVPLVAQSQFGRCSALDWLPSLNVPLSRRRAVDAGEWPFGDRVAGVAEEDQDAADEAEERDDGEDEDEAAEPAAAPKAEAEPEVRGSRSSGWDRHGLWTYVDMYMWTYGLWTQRARCRLLCGSGGVQRGGRGA
jgi:hypothetical protein